jgi:RHS repeat-associated protein
VVTDRLGSVVKIDSSTTARYFPYGDEPSTTQQDRPKFATYYRDATTALDYAKQRYYASTLGRFTSPDPYQASGGPADPQSWNRYAYVQNDPVNYYDPEGLFQCPAGASGCFIWNPIRQRSGGVRIGGGAHGDAGYLPVDLGDGDGGDEDGGGGGSIEPGPPQKYVFENVADADQLIRNAITGLAAFLTYASGRDCANWLQTGLAGSAYNSYGTVGAFLSALPDYVGSAKISGTQGSTTQAMVTSEVQGKVMLFNTELGFYKATDSFVRGDQFDKSIKSILPGTGAAQGFLLIHELGHLLSAAGFTSDVGSDTNQKSNNDLVWQHCGQLFLGVPRQTTGGRRP